MDARTLHPLDYAAARTKPGGRPLFKTVLAVCAALGVVANLWLVHLATVALHRAHWAHRDLTQNPRAYGREIAPETIASLREPWSLRVASAALVLAATLGLLLAVSLLVSAWQVDRVPASAARRMLRYRRWKPIGTVATAVAFFGFGSANHFFWVAATRHVPVGSGPPVLEVVALAVGALLPWRWLGNDYDGPPAAG